MLGELSVKGETSEEVIQHQGCKCSFDVPRKAPTFDETAKYIFFPKERDWIETKNARLHGDPPITHHNVSFCFQTEQHSSIAIAVELQKVYFHLFIISIQ